MDATKVVPNRVWLSLTGKCDNKCAWCYRAGSEVETYIDLSLVKTTINTLSKSGTKKCTLIGGEPTLHKKYREIIAYAADKFSSCTLVTNGHVLSRGIPEEWTGNKRVHIVVSLHGANKDHYVKNTGSQHGFELTIQAIRNLVKAGVNHSVNVVIGKENLPYIDEFISVASQEKVAVLCFTIAISPMDAEYETSPLDITKHIRSIHQKCIEFRQKHVFIFSLPWCLLEKSLLEELVANGNLMFNCPVDSGSGVVVKENGALLTCTHLSGKEHEIVSAENTLAVLSDPSAFTAFWNSKKLQEFREAVNVYRHQDCQKCRYRLHCKGGCPLWWETDNFHSLIERR